MSELLFSCVVAFLSIYFLFLNAYHFKEQERETKLIRLYVKIEMWHSWVWYFLFLVVIEKKNLYKSYISSSKRNVYILYKVLR